MPVPLRTLLPLLAAVGASGLLAAGQPDQEEAVGFNRDIRPIMSDTCFHCHGFDAKSRKGGLRLDLREEALKAGKSGALAIVPGKPEESEVIKRIFTTDEDDLMPSKESHKVLTPRQKELFRRWIAQGAPYEPHWAYMPLKAPVVPALPAGGRNPIDAFIGAKLAEKKISPSAEAPREKLLRRASLDLIGLPPTPEETAAFLADASPDAYEKQVDRLLASPHFGERMAVWWLDVARYADTVGFHGDQNQRIFPYRDYVINAFNANKPFDQFTREQLAGDLLPDPTEEQLVASGYNRLNMMTREGGAQAKEYLAKYGAERVRSVSGAWLGSTFGCAECHDHKFDPIKTADFYSLQAFFADVKQWGVYADYGYTPEPELKGINNDSPFPPEIRTRSPYLAKRDQEARAELSGFYARLSKSILEDAARRADFAQWRENTRSFLAKHPTGWAYPAGSMPAKKAPSNAKKSGASKNASADAPADFTEDQPIVLAHATSKSEDHVVTLRPGPGYVAAVRMDIAKGALKPGMQATLALTFAVVDGKGKERKLSTQLADATHRRPRYANGADLTDINTSWSLRMPEEDVRAVWTLTNPAELRPGESLAVRVETSVALTFRLGVSPLTHDDPLKVAEPAQLAAFADAATTQHAVLAPAVAAYVLTRQPVREETAAIRSRVARIRSYRGGEAWSLVTQAVTPLTVRVLPRGNWQDQSGPVVLPSTPSFLPGLRRSTPEKRLTRLDLADWICSQENPITARTVMNRLWQQFFGAGLSAALDDLGSQGEPPTHPELLDWLALEFRDKGWDLKKMVRLLATSHTYRQSSSLRPELRETDPNNRLLASQNPRRIEAEFVRDNALFIAGLLRTQDIGGPSVRPYQPDGYYEPLQFPNRTYVASTDDEQWRRGVYMHWQRTFLHPMLVNFDAPARDECTALRNYSNTPQQALTLLNDPTFVEAARSLAARALAAPADERIDRAFRLALSRGPKPAERTALGKLLAEQTAYYAAHPADAEKLIKVGLSPTPPLPPAELAAWTNLCRVLLNSHEVITRY